MPFPDTFLTFAQNTKRHKSKVEKREKFIPLDLCTSGKIRALAKPLVPMAAPLLTSVSQEVCSYTTALLQCQLHLAVLLAPFATESSTAGPLPGT